jgi:hypothetical protein
MLPQPIWLVNQCSLVAEPNQGKPANSAYQWQPKNHASVKQCQKRLASETRVRYN